MPPPVEPTVFIVDDDEAVRNSLRFLMKSVNLAAQAYPSAQSFLDAYDRDRPGCLVLDVRMPGMSGLDLQEKLKEMRSTLPIIFVTGHGDVPMAVQAMQQGAVEFLQKPFRDQDLIDRVNVALARDREQRAAVDQRQDIVHRIESLTKRESEIMNRIVEGQANKVIAFELGMSPRTVELHRARVMDKMGAASLAQLVRMVMEVRET